MAWRGHSLWYFYRRTEELRKQVSPKVTSFAPRKPMGAYMLKRSWRLTVVARWGGGNGFVRVGR